MVDPVPTACDQCHLEGESDTAPKVHYGVETYHHDCTPARVRKEIIDGSENPEQTKAIFDACLSGTKNDELRAHIAELHK